MQNTLHKHEASAAGSWRQALNCDIHPVYVKKKKKKEVKAGKVTIHKDRAYSLVKSSSLCKQRKIVQVI